MTVEYGVEYLEQDGRTFVGCRGSRSAAERSVRIGRELFPKPQRVMERDVKRVAGRGYVSPWRPSGSLGDHRKGGER